MLTAGTSPDTGSRTNANGTFSSVGQSAYQVSVQLDGVDNSSRAGGGELGYQAQAVTPSVDSIQEFKVVTDNNSAEYGRRMGGTVIVQTKSGANGYHGSAFEFLRNQVLDAANFFSVGEPKPGIPAQPIRRNFRRADPPQQALFLCQRGDHALQPRYVQYHDCAHGGRTQRQLLRHEDHLRSCHHGTDLRAVPGRALHSPETRSPSAASIRLQPR